MKTTTDKKFILTINFFSNKMGFFFQENINIISIFYLHDTYALIQIYYFIFTIYSKFLFYDFFDEAVMPHCSKKHMANPLCLFGSVYWKMINSPNPVLLLVQDIAEQSPTHFYL